MVDVLKHDKYSLGDIIAFENKDTLPGVQVQGRILSMWKEAENDVNCRFTISIIRRPFDAEPKDFIAQSHLIYEYWDTNEYISVNEDSVLKCIPCVSIDAESCNLAYLIDHFEKDQLKKGVIYISWYHDNDEEALFECIEPELILSAYHFDYDLEDYGNHLDWGSTFLLKLKKVIFDPFVSSLSKKASTMNFDLWKFLLSHRNLDTPILERIRSRQGGDIIKTNRMYRPTLCLPLIVDLIKKFFSLRDQSVAVIVEHMEKWEKGPLKVALKEISNLEHGSSVDPLYKEEVELVDDVPINTFIVRDGSDDDSSDEDSDDESSEDGNSMSSYVKRGKKEDKEYNVESPKKKVKVNYISDDSEEEEERGVHPLSEEEDEDTSSEILDILGNKEEIITSSDEEESVSSEDESDDDTGSSSSSSVESLKVGKRGAKKEETQNKRRRVMED